LTRADTPLPPINHQLSTINQQQSVKSVSKLLTAKERKEHKTPLALDPRRLVTPKLDEGGWTLDFRFSL
jgi:hypothetical protein